MIGKTPLSLNIPVPVKQSLMDLARKENISMTALIIKWAEENDPTLHDKLKNQK